MAPAALAVVLTSPRFSATRLQDRALPHILELTPLPTRQQGRALPRILELTPLPTRQQGRALPRIPELTPLPLLRPRGQPGQAPARRVCRHRVTPQLRCTYHTHTHCVHIRVSHSSRCRRPTSEPEHASPSPCPCPQDTGPRPPRQMRHHPQAHRTALLGGSRF
uniref:Uncharacterized protein n=1 Tax=Myotis myotis TaxID=51298 RepID=A0A7J7R2T8_MYOMY|nr:hypothetical protein mMyoMyo1_010925 [Myotis myotis]